MNKRVDVMVDIETLGTKSESTIFQIAAIAFDINTGEHYSTFNKLVDIAKNETMTVDGDTIKWWLNTNKVLLTSLLNSGTGSSESTLIDFHDWLVNLTETKEDLYLWGNGILFDNKMIQTQLQKINLDYPIHYKNDRDVRTILELAAFKTGKSEQEIKALYANGKDEHDALNDVEYQIDLTVDCYKLLMD